MRKTLIIFIILFSSLLSTKAQRNEIGPFLGTSFYLGDLNPSKHFFLPKPAFGLIYRYVLNQRWAIKVDGLYGSVEGSDAKAKFNEKRNLSFKSSIFEVSSQMELNFLPYLTGNKTENYFTPYIFAGISIFSFNPKAEYNGTWYNLQPLGTEGQETSYNNTQSYSLMKLAFPFGLGVKYSVGDNISIGAEWGLRKTTTDYLDDVSTTYADPEILGAEHSDISAILSDRYIKEPGENINNTGLQRGNSNNKDWYSYAGVFIVFKFNARESKVCPAYHKQKKTTKFRSNPFYYNF